MRRRAPPIALLLVLLVRTSYAPLRLRELEELKRFYNETSGADWTVNTNWDLGANSQCGFVDQSIPAGWPYYAPEMAMPTSPECIYKDPCDTLTKWYGVGCVDPCYAPTDGDNCVFGRVTQVALRQNSLQGTIPNSFFDELVNISMLDLAQNGLSGTIPSTVGKLRNLRTWNFNSNRFSGSIPSQIAHIGSSLGLGYGDGGLEGLTYIDLAHNNLTGILPSQIGFLENVEYLDTSDNPNLGFLEGGNLNLNPGMPTQIGMLANILTLKVDSCGFSGTVPTQVGEMAAINNLLLRGTTSGLQPVTNRFSGTIPTQVGKLEALMNVALNDNRFSGTIPPQIGGMYMLTRWELQENFLSGTMPDAFGGLPKLEWWDTYGNFMTGPLPESIQNATRLDHLYIQIEHTDVIRNSRCRERIPGQGHASDPYNIPSHQAGMKVNWFIQVAEYYNYQYASACYEPFDTHTAFEALSGDI